MMIKLGKLEIYTIVDDDSPALAHRWWLSGIGYAEAKIDGKKVMLHHFVAGKPPKGFCIDHINRNKLDNRRVNLRVVTHAGNMLNQSVQKKSKSGVKGVTYDSYYKKWAANGTKDKVNYRLGLYRDINDAIKARKEWEQLHV